MNCKYSQLIKKSIWEQYLNCSLTCSKCIKQKFCHQQDKAVNTDDWEQCPILKRGDNNDGKSKETKNRV